MTFSWAFSSLCRIKVTTNTCSWDRPRWPSVWFPVAPQRERAVKVEAQESGPVKGHPAPCPHRDQLGYIQTFVQNQELWPSQLSLTSGTSSRGVPPPLVTWVPSEPVGQCHRVGVGEKLSTLWQRLILFLPALGYQRVSMRDVPIPGIIIYLAIVIQISIYSSFSALVVATMYKTLAEELSKGAKDSFWSELK